LGAGLAGIAPASLAFNDEADGAGLWFVRPFLETRRDELRQWLGTQSQDWIDDPSNANMVFERAAIRAELAAAGPEAAMALRYVQAEAAGHRVHHSREAARLLSFYVTEPVPGLVRIDPGIFQAADLQAINMVLRVLISFAGGSASVAPEQIADFVMESAMRSGFGIGRKPARRNACGAVIDVRKDAVWLLRERRRHSVPTAPFDNRYRIINANRPPRRPQLLPARGKIAASLMKHALQAEPLYQAGEGDPVAAVLAAQSGEPLRRLLNPWPDLVPGFDAKLAETLSIMAGEGRFPPCPVHPDGKK
jgi:tRNA(Ile)-lysidine synthase